MSDLVWIGWLITLMVFVITSLLNRYYKKCDRINKEIDAFIKLVIDTEDKALAFWVQGCGKTYEYQLILNIRRISRSMEDMSKINKKLVPAHVELIKFKQAMTLQDPTKRPVADRSPTAIGIMSYSAKLQAHYQRPI